MSTDPDFHVYRSEYLDYVQGEEGYIDGSEKLIRNVLVVPGATPTLQPWQVYHSPITADGVAATTVFTLPTAAQLVAQVDTPQVGDSTVLDVYNDSTTNSTAVLAGTGGTGISPAGDYIVGPLSTGKYIIKFTNITPGAEAYTVMAADNSTLATNPSYAYFFGLAPADYGAPIAVNSPIPFPQDGPFGVIDRDLVAPTTTFLLPQSGVYEIEFVVSVTEAAQLGLWLDPATGVFARVTSMVFGRASVTSEVVGHGFVTVNIPNSRIQVRNDASVGPITVTANAGGVNATAASLTVKRVA